VTTGHTAFPELSFLESSIGDLSLVEKVMRLRSDDHLSGKPVYRQVVGPLKDVHDQGIGAGNPMLTVRVKLEHTPPDISISAPA
jgi:hypothetical protein